MVSYFLQHIKYEKRLSHHTVTAYEGDLKQFSAFLLYQYEFKEPEKADFQMIRSWIVALVDEKIENRSINRKIATLRTFYNFLLRHKAITTDPIEMAAAATIAARSAACAAPRMARKATAAATRSQRLCSVASRSPLATRTRHLLNCWQAKQKQWAAIRL